jgi:hypothetical protein
MLRSSVEKPRSVRRISREEPRSPHRCCWRLWRIYRRFSFTTSLRISGARFGTQRKQAPRARAVACVDMIAPFYLQTGRPLVWMTECAEHAAVRTIADFRILRPINLAVALATSVYLGSVVGSFIGGPAFGALAAFAVVLAPGYSFMYLQGLSATMVLLSLLLAVGSFSQWMKGRWTLSLTLFLVACLIYPAYAFIVIALALIEFGFSDSDDVRKRLKRLALQIGFYLAASLLYYAGVKMLVGWVGRIRGPLPSIGMYEVVIRLTPVQFFQRARDAATYFYAMPPLNFPAPAPATVLIVVAFSVYVAGRISGNRNERSLRIIGRTVLCFGLSAVVLLGAVSPWLFSRMESLSTRHLMPWYVFLCATAVGLVHRGLRRIRATSRWTPLLVVLSLGSPVALVQYRLSMAEVIVTGREIQAMRDRLDEWIDRKGWEVDRYLLVVMPTVSRPAMAQALLNDVKYGNDNAVLASSKNPVSVPWMATAILRERPVLANFQLVDCAADPSCAGIALEQPANVVVGYTNGLKPVQSPVDPFVINLSSLTAKPVTPTIVRFYPPTVTASSMLDNYNPYGLLFSGQPGWHAARNPKYPQRITIDFKQPRDIRAVSFLPQDDHVPRMPKTVQIRLSNDGLIWNEIAAAEDLCDSHAIDDWRTVRLSRPSVGRYLEIRIVANCGDQAFLTLRGLKVD